MSPAALLDFTGVRTRVEHALADEDRTGELRALLSSRRITSGAADDVSHAVEQAKRCITFAVERMAAVQASALSAGAGECGRILRLLQLLLAYWDLESDVVIDEHQGICGLIDDALLSHMLLDRLEAWYNDETGASLTPVAPWQGGSAELHVFFTPDVNRALLAVRDAIWEDQDYGPLLTPISAQLAFTEPRHPAEQVLLTVHRWTLAPQKGVRRRTRAKWSVSLRNVLRSDT
jgi:hypothetical protein